jgi:hypothetical protein
MVPQTFRTWTPRRRLCDIPQHLRDRKEVASGQWKRRKKKKARRRQRRFRERVRLQIRIILPIRETRARGSA